MCRVHIDNKHARGRGREEHPISGNARARKLFVLCGFEDGLESQINPADGAVGQRLPSPLVGN